MARLRWISRLPWATEKVELTLSLLHQLGLKTVVGSFLSGAFLAAAAWTWSHVSWWGAVLIALVASYYLAGLIHRIQLIRATSKYEPIIVPKDQDFIGQIEHQHRLFNLSKRRRSIPQPQGNDQPNDPISTRGLQ
jgi:hypothetical protein